MARDFTATQQANISAPATRPVYLVEWGHSGLIEYLSCSGEITYDGQLYTAGGLSIVNIEDSQTATISLPATAERIAEIQNNYWRGGICKITFIAAAPGDGPTYTADKGFIALDGVIEDTQFAGETITVNAKNKYYRGALTPRFTFEEAITASPAVGEVAEYDGEVYSFEQWLKTTAAIQSMTHPGRVPHVIGRQTTTQANEFVSTGQQVGQKLLTAQGVYAPIAYGRVSVPGYIFAQGQDGSGNNFYGVAFCVGGKAGVKGVETLFINDVVAPSTVAAKHYKGLPTQTASPALNLYAGGWTDRLVMETPAGDMGIVYSVVNIPSGAITGYPRFRAILEGRLVPDPSSTAADPYQDSVAFSFDFVVDAVDAGPNGLTLTLNGDAVVTTSTGLVLDGAGDYATAPDSAPLEAGSSVLTLEIEGSATSIAAGTETLICHGVSPNRSIKIDRIADELFLYISSDGTTWDIASALSCGVIAAATDFRVAVEVGVGRVSTYLDGDTQTGAAISDALFDSTDLWEFGAEGGSQEWDGIIRSARYTINQYRYGAPHSELITNTPFSDSGIYPVGYAYTENPVLCWNDLATDAILGLAATTAGVAQAAAYCDALELSTGVARCKLGLVLSEPKVVERWLDQLALYGNALWFPDGSDFKIISDKAKDGTNGSGPELVTLPTTAAAETITTEDAVSYSISVEITTAATVGNLTVEFGGVEVIAAQTAVGIYGVLVDASGTSNDVEVVENASWNGAWVAKSVKRTHRLVSNWMPSTLSVAGLPEGDKPTAVAVRYTVPDDTTGAWRDRSFGVLNASAAAGNPIVLTTLNLPGIYRTDEASNKALAKLYREDRKTRVGFIHTDEGVVLQPGDTVQVVKASRGVDTPVWIESNRFVTYGRHNIQGLIYRDNQFPDTAYDDDDPDITGTFVGGGHPEVVIGGPFAPECIPFSCSALIDEQGRVADVNGSGMWDLLDYNDSPSVIPAYFEGSGTFVDGAVELTCSDSGDTWGGNRITSSVLVSGDDLDVCEVSPRCSANTWGEGNSASWSITPLPKWGNKTPNIAMSVVLRGVSAYRGATARSRLWLGYGSFTYYGQISGATGGDQHQIHFKRHATLDIDYLIFDLSADSEHIVEIPFGMVTSSVSCLLSVSVSGGPITYPASGYQGYYYASYDAMQAMTYTWSILRADGVSASGSHTTASLKIAQPFDHTHSNGNTRPINEAYKLKSKPSGTNNNSYLNGEFGGIYNLAIAHDFGGNIAGLNMEGGSAGTADSSLDVAFMRNFSDYVLPGYCPAP